MGMNKNDFPMQDAKLKNAKEIQYQEGVFLLSNPEDVQELIRSLKAQELRNSQESQNRQSARYDSYNGFSACIQSIEERLWQQEHSITEGIRFIINELAFIRKILEQQVNEKS